MPQLALASRSPFVHFVQPALGCVVVGAMFLVSLFIGRPLIARFAGDFVSLTEAVSARPSVSHLYRRLTLLWAVVNFFAAVVTLALLLALPTAGFVAIRPLIGWVITVPAVVLTVSLSVRVARAEGLLVSINGKALHARGRSEPDEQREDRYFLRVASLAT